MTTHFVNVPGNLDLAHALAFAREVAALPDNTAILGLNFDAWKQVKPSDLPLKPFGMLAASMAVQRFKARVPTAVIVPATPLPNNGLEGYAAHMGMLKACGIDLGKAPGEAKGSPTYLPITRIENPSRLDGDTIEARSLQLARQLTQQQDGGLVLTLKYSLTEIIRNVAEHAQSPDSWLCAQYWQSRGEAEIALIDSGRGLRASLSKNPVIREQLVDDRAAIKFALMPGVSRNVWKGNRQRDDDWANSGFGLYMNYRICSEGGSFFIASGDTGIYCEKDSEHETMAYDLPGVALRLRMRVETMENYKQKFHEQFIADGMREAKRMAGGMIPTGERMSQMLRSGFAPSKDDA
jgi:anti-sigma regulatory factor (Ser/Thr protein kinase)